MPLTKNDLKKVSDYLWEIPQTFRSDMRVPARVYASEKMIDEIFRDKSLEQLVNIATLPGIYKYALVMPDAHEGYGFPIGGVAATRYPDGIISPGGIGYDINCGVRLLKSQVPLSDIKSHLVALGRELYRTIPSGVGRGGILKLKEKELDEVLAGGAGSMVNKGYGREDDLEKLESRGRLENADPALVQSRAKERGRDQLGTMGAGNHFVEVQVVEEIFDKPSAALFGLNEGEVTVMIHTGSRGLGHQIATDYIKKMLGVMDKYGIKLPDLELAGVPFSSPEGASYFQAMACAANFAWANRQLITYEVRRAWEETFADNKVKLEILYDVAHNLAKIEEYDDIKLIIHRKGATRAFPDQPVLIPGSMGTASYVLVGQEGSMKDSFGSTCHGAGRLMSRHAAKRSIKGSSLKAELLGRGIHVEAGSMSGLVEEAPQAYKNIDEVVEVVHRAGIAKKVARLKPLSVIKG